mmetsp:Transcript_37251/g.125837  ORF Transcript_37251/g.125837 Transcript_37251/m.125837 type:complete len:261 (+) Transcript_37251:684-1466(+)
MSFCCAGSTFSFPLGLRAASLLASTARTRVALSCVSRQMAAVDRSSVHVAQSTRSAWSLSFLGASASTMDRRPDRRERTAPSTASAWGATGASRRPSARAFKATEPSPAPGTSKKQRFRLATAAAVAGSGAAAASRAYSTRHVANPRSARVTGSRRRSSSFGWNRRFSPAPRQTSGASAHSATATLLRQTPGRSSTKLRRRSGAACADASPPSKKSDRESTRRRSFSGGALDAAQTPLPARDVDDRAWSPPPPPPTTSTR